MSKVIILKVDDSGKQVAAYETQPLAGKDLFSQSQIDGLVELGVLKPAEVSNDTSRLGEIGDLLEQLSGKLKGVLAIG